MKKIFFWAVLLLLPATITAQDTIQVKTTFDKSNVFNGFTVEIINKTDSGMLIANIGHDRNDSYLDLYLYDKDGQQVPASYFQTFHGVPFIIITEKSNSFSNRFLVIKPKSSLTFKFSTESLLRSFCREPERVKKIKFKIFIRYSIGDGKGFRVYEQFSKTFTL